MLVVILQINELMTLDVVAYKYYTSTCIVSIYTIYFLKRLKQYLFDIPCTMLLVLMFFASDCGCVFEDKVYQVGDIWHPGSFGTCVNCTCIIDDQVRSLRANVNITLCLNHKRRQIND